MASARFLLAGSDDDAAAVRARLRDALQAVLRVFGAQSVREEVDAACAALVAHTPSSTALPGVSVGMAQQHTQEQHEQHDEPERVEQPKSEQQNEQSEQSEASIEEQPESEQQEEQLERVEQLLPALEQLTYGRNSLPAPPMMRR